MKFDVKKVKIHVTVPEEKVSELRDAICHAGAGIIGNYTYCTTSAKISGTFKPNDEANPYIGTKNTLEFVEEIDLAFVCDVKKVKQILQIIHEIHPYEEPAIDIIPLIDANCFKK